MSEPTTYIVLVCMEQNPDGKWAFFGRHEADNSEQAIRKAFAKSNVTESRFAVAVPSRSWKPVRAQTVQTTVLKLENAEPS
jgi:hypothetical protein